MSISWPATLLPTYSPVPPPIISVPPIAATRVALPIPLLASLPPRPLARPIVANSIPAIAAPLFLDLVFKSCNFSGLSKIAFILSFAPGSLMFPPISSINNSLKVKPASIMPIDADMAPAIAPGTAPTPKP